MSVRSGEGQVSYRWLGLSEQVAAEILECVGEEETIVREGQTGTLIGVPLASLWAGQTVIDCVQGHPVDASQDLFISLVGGNEASYRVGPPVSRVIRAVLCRVLFSFTTLTYANELPQSIHRGAPILYSLCLGGLADDDLSEWVAAFGRQLAHPVHGYDLCLDVGDQGVCDRIQEFWRGGHVAPTVLLRTEVETVRDSDVVTVVPHVVNLHGLMGGELEFSYRLIRG